MAARNLMKQNIFQIAIDGPAASGKSMDFGTTAKLVALRLRFTYIDSALNQKLLPLTPETAPIISHLAQATKIRFVTATSSTTPTFLPQTTVFLDDKDVSSEIRSIEITRNVSIIAANPEVRKAMLAKQREFAHTTECDGLVMDGRDIGTVIFPNANVKVFLTADANVRAMRRFEEWKKGSKTDIKYEEILEDIEKRDKADLERAISPLRKADDAVTIDTTELSINEQVERIIELTNLKR
ncbi:hypothetical protein G9A89_014310 [Geosiphon pyriformis]|nr:hypothetical protein G9A89_014310 [Geosiphon pyriformis]